MFVFGYRAGAFVAIAERKIGVSSQMNTVESPSERIRYLHSSNPAVLVTDWAESLLDLERSNSRRRHPTNRGPAWSQDGGDDSAEWALGPAPDPTRGMNWPNTC